MDKAYRSQFANNTLASVLAFAVSAIIGFVMPWLIFEQIGQSFLGIWDLGWSLLLFLSLSSLGFGPALVYFLANESAGRHDAICVRWIRLALLLQALFAIFVSAFFKIGFEIIHNFGPAFTVDEAAALSRLGTILGITVFVALLGDIARSTLIGFHQSKTSEYISIAHDITLAFSMLTSLYIGGGIVWLALLTLVNRLFFETVRFYAAYRDTGLFQLLLTPSSTHEARRLIRYAIKSTVFVLQENFTLQIARLLLFLSAGPAALAVFSRYATLFRQINLFIDRIGLTIPAMVSRYQSDSAHEDIQRLYFGFTQVTMLISLPLLIVFGVLGDAIVTFWMSAVFVEDGLALVFALGGVLYANYSAAAKVLSGLNMHGTIAVRCLVSAVVSTLVLGYMMSPFSSIEAALLVAVTSVFFLQSPFIFYLSKKFNLSCSRTMLRINARPFLCNILFLICLLWANEYYSAQSYVAFASVSLIGVSGLLASYWFFGIEQNLKDNLFAFFDSEQKNS